MAHIHPTAIVSPKAELAASVTVGPFTIIHDDVRIDENTRIGSHVLIDNGARIGRNNDIQQGAVLGTPPQDLKYRNEKTELFVGDNNTIREYVTFHRATTATWKTVVGNDSLFMAYAHVAHDCRVSDKVILANAVQLGGHTEVGEYAIIGGVTGVHQFSHIGAHSMVGGCLKVTKDVPPFSLVDRYPLRFGGVNAIGLRRRGFTREAIDAIEAAYRAIYFSGMNVSQGVQWIIAHTEITPDVQHILDFIAASTRGIVRPIGQN